jgi:NAD(P)-dependent dehydrogenase (short-subunit alcohol dehydrogenase family)
MNRFENKVVIVTGGSSGIGRAAALAFAREGAKVALAARGAERGEEVAHEITRAGGQAIFIKADMATATDVENLVNRTISKFLRLDCAFNNAATAEGVLTLAADFTEDQFDRVIAANLKGVWLCMKYQIPRMLKQDPQGGAIVNTSSVNGLGGSARGAIYSASKAGVLALTKSAAQDYAKRGIRVNALVAGAFQTPMLQSVFDTISGGDPEGAEKVKGQYEEYIPLGRIGNPEEAAEAALWLCSDAASYVTGNSMIVDGGLTAPWR